MNGWKDGLGGCVGDSRTDGWMDGGWMEAWVGEWVDGLNG